MSYHQKRYEKTLRHVSTCEAKNLLEFLTPPKKGLFRCRMDYEIVDGECNIKSSYFEYKKREITSLKLLHDNEIEYEFKSANRDKIDELFATRGLCDDILIVKNSLIKDTTIANIAFWDGVKWVTPSSPLLAGTTRERLLAGKKIFEEEIYERDLKRFQKVALMNAMIDFDIITKSAKDIFC
jgi:4-amino-4-deoxychorismate lyase